MARGANRISSAATARFRLARWLDEDRPLSDLTAKRCHAAYDNRAKERQTATHRGELAQLKRFTRWCQGKGWLSTEQVDGIGAIRPQGRVRDRRRAPALRLNDAVAFGQLAWERACSGDEGAIAALLCFDLGIDSGECRALRLADVEALEGMAVVHLRDGEHHDVKTPDRERVLVLPRDRAAPLLARCRQLEGGTLLFPADSAEGFRTKTWLLKRVRGIAKDAGISEWARVTVHGLRKYRATMQRALGSQASAIAGQLGHSSSRTTSEYYVDRGVDQQATMSEGLAMMRVLEKASLGTHPTKETCPN